MSCTQKKTDESRAGSKHMSIITDLIGGENEDNDIFHYVIMYMGTRVKHSHTPLSSAETANRSTDVL